MFALDEVAAILSLPLGTTNLEDSLLWHFEKTGTYTVKNGYKLGKFLQSRESASVSDVGDWWSRLWSLQIP